MTIPPAPRLHGVPVLTEWSLDALRSEMAGEAPVFFIVTNSRSLPPKEAREINEQIGPNLLQIGGEIGQSSSSSAEAIRRCAATSWSRWKLSRMP